MAEKTKQKKNDLGLVKIKQSNHPCYIKMAIDGAMSLEVEAGTQAEALGAIVYLTNLGNTIKGEQSEINKIKEESKKVANGHGVV